MEGRRLFDYNDNKFRAIHVNRPLSIQTTSDVDLTIGANCYSKTEVDNLRLDFNERIANLQVKIQERDRYIEVCNEGIASKLDQKILEIRSKFQSESECGRTGVDNSDDLRLKIKQLLSEREEDL